MVLNPQEGNRMGNRRAVLYGYSGIRTIGYLPMPIKLFLLEDQAMFRELVCRTLKDALPTISIVGAFGSADELVAAAQFVGDADVGLLDVRLGGQECFEFLPLVRQAAPRARLIWVTSILEDVLLQRAMDANLPGFIHKEDTTDELITAIQRVAAGGTFMSPSVRQLRDGLRTRADLFSKVLSPREQQILKLLGGGFTNEEAAAVLGLSAQTIKTHRRNIMARLDLHSASELQAYAIRNGFVAPRSLR